MLRNPLLTYGEINTYFNLNKYIMRKVILYKMNYKTQTNVF